MHLTNDDIRGLSNGTQGVLIRLNVACQQARELWFWERWLGTKHWQQQRDRLDGSLSETIEVAQVMKGREQFQADREALLKFYHEALKVYQRVTRRFP